MDYKAAVISCIERIDDDDVDALKRIYALAKKAGKESRCAPKRRRIDSPPTDMRDEMITVMIRNRAAR